MRGYTKMAVHGGVFHADDVLCAALLRYEYPYMEVIRTNNIDNIDNNTLVCDIGGMYDPEMGRLDHHNDCPSFWGNHTKAASIGLLLEFLCYEMEDFTEPWIRALETIQAIDNGLKLETPDPFGEKVSRMVRLWNPVWDSNASFDEAFDEVVDFMIENFIKPAIDSTPVFGEDLFGEDVPEWVNSAIDEKIAELTLVSEEAEMRAEQIVKSALEDREYVVLPIFAPWQKVLVPSAAKFVIYPAARGGWNLQCIPPELNSFSKKKELPDWSKDHPEGMTFQHPGRFLAAFKTQQQAIDAAASIA